MITDNMKVRGERLGKGNFENLFLFVYRSVRWVEIQGPVEMIAFLQSPELKRPFINIHEMGGISVILPIRFQTAAQLWPPVYRVEDDSEIRFLRRRQKFIPLRGFSPRTFVIEIVNKRLQIFQVFGKDEMT